MSSKAVQPAGKAQPIRRPGRPRKDLSGDQVALVERLAGRLNLEQIADLLGMGETALRTRFREDPAVAAAYKRGHADAVDQVAESLWIRAVGGDIAAMCFYLKTQGRWKETHRVETETLTRVDVYHHSPVEQLRSRIARLAERN